MEIKNNKKIAVMGVLILEAAFVLISFIAAAKAQKQKEVLEFTSDMLAVVWENEGNLEMEDGTGSLAVTPPCYDRRIVSPAFTLNKGIYQTDIFYQSTTPFASSTGSHTFSTGEDSAWVDSESVLLTSRATHVDYRTYVRKNDTLITVRSVMDDDLYDTVTIERIVVTPLEGRTIAVLLIKLLTAFLLIDAFLYWLLYKKSVTSTETIVTFVGLLTLLFLTELPMTLNHILKGYDLRFHYYRIYSIAMGLQEGIFPVKIQPEWMNGYGYATGVFYGDIFLYLPAVLYALGFSLHGAYKCYVLAMNGLTIITAYYCFKQMGKHKYFGVCGAAVYSMSLHRLVATYTRAAAGAFTAMAFLPLIILGLWEIYQEEEKEKKNGWIFLGLGLTGILESHVLGTIMTCLFILLFVLICFKKTFQVKTLLSFGKAAVLTVLLNLFFIVPFLHMYLGTKLRIQAEHRSISEYSAFLAQLFAGTYNAVGDVREDLAGMYHDMPMTLGPVSLIIILSSILCVLIFKTEKKARELSAPLILIAAALWLSTNLFPYNWLEEHCPPIFYVLMKFEFAWRFQAIATALMPVLFLMLLLVLKEHLTKEKLLLFGGIITLLAVWQGADYIFQYNDGMIPFEHEADFRDISIGAIYNGQYVPEGFYEKDLNPEITISNPENAEFTLLEGGKLDYKVLVENRQDAKISMEFPLIAYNGYRAESSEGCLKVSAGENSRLRVTVPAGFSGEIHVYFKSPWFWRLSEAISLLTLLALIAFAVMEHRGRQLKKI